MASGDDIEAGRITAAEETTDLIAQIPTGGHHTPFAGDIIFRVSAQQGGKTRPDQTLDAIWGKGSNGQTLFSSVGGVGVTGVGGANHGTGVLGRGGAAGETGRTDPGNGGIGVIGQGGAAVERPSGRRRIRGRACSVKQDSKTT